MLFEEVKFLITLTERFTPKGNQVHLINDESINLVALVKKAKSLNETIVVDKLFWCDVDNFVVNSLDVVEDLILGAVWRS